MDPRGWRWANVPVPEPHVGGLVVGTWLHFIRPWSLPLEGFAVRGAGALLLVGGIGLALWAVRVAGPERLDTAATPVTSGAYALSRHPMYVGWTAVYIGVALLSGLAWSLALLPLVVVWTHVVVIREERRLETRFGEAYRAYRDDVRRYL